MVKRFCAAPDILEEAGEDPTPIFGCCGSTSYLKRVMNLEMCRTATGAGDGDL